MQAVTWGQNTQRILNVNTTRIEGNAIYARMLADKHARAERLAKAVRRAGYDTYRAAAERHHFKEPTLTSHANGTRSFDLETGYEYARAFKVDPAWLLGLRDDEPKQPVPTESELNAMVDSALRELPVGASLGDLAKVVSSSLRDQLERYLTGGGHQDTSDAATFPGKALQPGAPTRPSSGG